METDGLAPSLEDERQTEQAATSAAGAGEGLCRLWTRASDDDLIREFFFSDVDGEQKRLPSGSQRSLGDVARTLSFAKVQLKERVLALDKREADLSLFEAELRKREAKLRENSVSHSEIRKKIELSKKLAEENLRLQNELKVEKMRADPASLTAELEKAQQQVERMRQTIDAEKLRNQTLKNELDALKLKKGGEDRVTGKPDGKAAEAAFEKQVEKLERRVTTLNQRLNEETLLKKQALEELAVQRREREKLELKLERLNGLLEKERKKASTMARAVESTVKKQASFGKDLSIIEELTKASTKAKEEAEAFVQRSKERLSRENSGRPPSASSSRRHSQKGDSASLETEAAVDEAAAMEVATGAGEECGAPSEKGEGETIAEEKKREKKPNVVDRLVPKPSPSKKKGTKASSGGSHPLRVMKMPSAEEQLFLAFNR